jgi:hypothetical protein
MGQLPSLVLRKPSARDCPRNCRSALECGSLLPLLLRPACWPCTGAAHFGR